jgi:hypothetical protein
MQEGQACPELLIQQPVEFLTAVTRKSPTVWSYFMDHEKAKRVGYHNGIRSSQSFSQSEAQKLRSVLQLFCSETEFSSDAGHQNSVTSKPLIERSHMSNG